MSESTFEELRGKVDSIYLLVNVASRRARELLAGAPRLIETESTDPLKIALEEISQGKITWKRNETIPEGGEEEEAFAVEEEEAG